MSFHSTIQTETTLGPDSIISMMEEDVRGNASESVRRSILLLLTSSQRQPRDQETSEKKGDITMTMT